MRILALDPGERVGWARADVADDGTWADTRHGITPLRDMAMALHKALSHQECHEKSHIGMYPAPEYDVIVVEEWRLYPGHAVEFIGSSFPSVQFIGMVRLCCWLSNTKLVMQGANLKTTADKTMKALLPDLYDKVTRPIKHDDGHDLDAIRHLWFYTYRNFPVEKAA